ncbi:hypothetical protein PULV_a0332 [Pseudoalteromonas ulvae UL12]|uniref:OB-fold-containig protein n=1 Tax=Pseudoalteromonas ulvae TaxID=107327 RepID=UPI00186B85ED|nr:OB-fold-containig protein [Pseudoalteromonas ulvae]MBE0362769.1 hypothetical protein [Pseudoalteromonas ulvae UL12]
MDFLNLAFTFPTIIFSALLLVVLLFWMTTIIGFADIDMFESDIDADTTQSTDTNLWSNMGFGDIPLTVSISLVVMFSWLISIYAHQLFINILGNGPQLYIIGLLMILTCLLVSVPVAAIISRPLQRFFKSAETSQSSDLIGLECTVITGKVTNTFGQARTQFQGTEQLIEVRVENNDTFTSGDTAVLLDYLKEKHCYIIAAKPW